MTNIFAMRSFAGMACGMILVSAGIRGTASPDADSTERAATLLLRARCLSCHNGDVKSGGIDLSGRTMAVASGAFVPGHSADSKLVRMVNAGKMPPTGPLSRADRELLARWIDSGAAWASDGATKKKTALWSLQPVRHPAPPHSHFDSLSANPIDRFVFAQLTTKRLAPSALADRLALLRRVTIDLTGLPPTPQEIANFRKDTSASAYEKVVDRLLASPAYGERWGRHWLDVVRYGESQGYEQNHLRPNSWPYRDYVIRAFNQDKPYPEFIAEQLAGDVLATKDPSTGAATGFLVAGIHDTVGIQTDEGTRQQRANDLDDMVSTTGAAFLGLTVGCAKCHDHKFDPIPQRDYYRLTACFAGVRHGERPLTTAADQARRQHEIDTLTTQMQAATTALNGLEAQARNRLLQSRGITPETRPSINARHNLDDFAPVTARFIRFTILATADGSEPCLDELQVFGANLERNLALASTGAKATASSLLPGYAIHQIAHLNDGLLGNEHSWISATPGSGWAQIELPMPMEIRRVLWSRDGVATTEFADRLASAYRIEVSLNGKSWQTVSTQAGRIGTSGTIAPDELQQALSPSERAEHLRLVSLRTDLERRLSVLNAQSRAYVGQFTMPDPIFLLRRGDVMQRIEPVTPGAFSCVDSLNPSLDLPPGATEPERRLALAKWIGDPRNPLTARVLVNRVWQYHFGRGLVGTPSDFGHNGEKPTHPELLDWLASDFMAHGWRIKRLHRLMVTSYTYQQAARANPQGLARDAGNQLLWRMPLRRLEAEAIRDAILQTSGKLDRRMGGPSFPLFRYRVVNIAIYEPLENYGPETWRRSVYQQSARSIHDELLSAFDCPESSQRAPRRDSTTTALQALNLLNGPFMQQQAGFMAERLKAQVGRSLVAQTNAAFKLAFGRLPNRDERLASLALVTDQGLPALCRVLFNANEFLYY